MISEQSSSSQYFQTRAKLATVLEGMTCASPLKLEESQLWLWRVWYMSGSPYFSATSVCRTPPAGIVHARADRSCPPDPTCHTCPTWPSCPTFPSCPCSPSCPTRPFVHPSVHMPVHPSYPSPPPLHTEPKFRHSSLFTPLDRSGASEQVGERLLHYLFRVWKHY